MAHLLRGKQAGISNDLSAGFDSNRLALDDVTRYGINSQISRMAYDPVQSLLAVGTKSSKFGPGQVYIFGQGRVQIVLPIPGKDASVTNIQFCAEKVVTLDTKNDVCVFSLELKRMVASYSPPGIVNILCTDPMLDYAVLGMQNGDILAYDMDRESPAPFRIPNLWVERDARARVTTIASVQFHPRDIGTLLVGFAQGAVIYSFKLNKALRFFQYEVPPGAPGGDDNPAMMNILRRPRLTQATWHPTGTFIMTGHEDGSIVFWDTIKDGRMLMARTITDTNIATPGRGSKVASHAVSVLKEPLYKFSWCANGQDPEDTAILIAGGQSTQSPTKGLALFEMGRTPVYATSSWELLASYFESPKRQRILATPPGAEVVDYCLIPRTSPHFAGAHDPIAVIALLSSGELVTLSFPSGMPINPTNQLHISLSFVHPFIKSLYSSDIPRLHWLGLQEKRQQGPKILQGGAELPSHLRGGEFRSLLQTVHADGTLRIWDPGFGDEIENSTVLHVDVARAISRFDNIEITQVSFAGASAELAIGLRSGEFLIYRWRTNKSSGAEPPRPRTAQPGFLTTISDRTDPSLSHGLCPSTLLDQQDGAVTAVRMSDIGFAAAAFEGGSIVVVDLRGPAIILNTNISNLSKHHHLTGSIRRRAGSTAGDKPEWVTQLEFSIMMLDGEHYSSICLHAGTNHGNLATFKVLPDPSGRYTVEHAGTISLDSSKIMYIAPINADTGNPATAAQETMGALPTGIRINGALLVATPTSIHIFRPATSKGAHKTFDSYFCDAARIIHPPNDPTTHTLLALFGDGTARIYSLPSLRELRTIPLTTLPGPHLTSTPQLDLRRFHEAVLSSTGHILAFTGPSEIAQLTIFGTGEPLPRRQDKIWDAERLIPPRPTISSLQWVTGTQYITPVDLDLLIGGPHRPPSKRMVAQARAEEEERKRLGSRGQGSSNSQDQGYWAYMQRQIQERTEKLGIVGDGMETLERNSANWLEDVNKFVGRQKKNAAAGIIKARFGI